MPQEFVLFEYVRRNAGRVVKKSMMLDKVWGCEFSRIPMWWTSTSTDCAGMSTPMAKCPAFEPCVVLGMFSGTARPIMQSAAWRISLWAALVFACGTMVVFVFLHQFVAGDIQRGDQRLALR
jgi:hypothetical protein